MTTNATPPRSLRLTAALLVVALLGACSGGNDEPDGASKTPTEESSSSAAAEPYLDVPAGVELTGAGTELGLGESALVAWQPRQEKVTALEVAVDRVEQTTFKKSFKGWQIDKQTAKSTPYFVRIKATNPTTTDFGGLDVRLYLADDADTLVEASTFKGEFAPCAGGVLPKTFKKGAEANLCLVYFVAKGREFANVTFQLPGDLAPVTWTGEVSKDVKPAKPAPTGKQSKPGKKGKQAPSASPTDSQ